MRTFTKSLLMFLLLLASGAVSAQGGLQLVLERDWTTTDSYPYYWMGDADNQPNFCGGTATVEVVDGALRIENTQEQGNNWDLQPFVLDWFNTTEGEDYVIRVWMKSDVDGSANLSIGTWSKSGNATLEFHQSENFELYTVSHTAEVTSTGNDEHILWQMGKTVGVVYLQKIQILKKGVVLPPLSNFGLWSSVIKNGDIEGDDLSSFPVSHNGGKAADTDKADALPEVIEDGVDGGKCLKVMTDDEPAQSWGTQFFIKANEKIARNTEWKLKMNIKADREAQIITGAHAEPRSWKGGFIDAFNVTEDWEEYEWSGSIGVDDFQSIAFDLNADGNDNMAFYFDNIDFSAKTPAIDAMYNKTCMRILFPYYTNIIQLVEESAKGKKRLMMPTDCITVKVNGEVVPLMSVEADLEGQLYVFFDESWDGDVLEDEDTQVFVTFNNPEDAAFRLFHMDSNGTVGDAVEFADAIGHLDEEDELIEVMSYLYGAPEVMSSDPEEGSFNLPATISEFKVVFDKKAAFARIKAKLDNENLTVEPVEPEENFAIAVTLKRTGSTPLADGEHIISIDKIYGEVDLGDEYYSTGEIKFTTGKQVSEELLAALKTANDTKTANDSSLYAGSAYTALVEAITKYEAEVEGYTAPSVINAAIIDLNDLVKAMNAHHNLIDAYIASNGKVQELAEQFADSKFNTTPLYLQLKAVAEKYAGKEITLDDELTAANAELKPMADLCGDMFTEGESRLGDAGYKVLTERLRLGVELLKELGVSEEDPVIVASNNSITDNDDLANSIKAIATMKTYEAIKTNKDEFFKVISEDFDEETGDEIKITKTYDMSVFAKNPNIYAHQQSKGFAEGNVPGWTASGNGNLYANTTWQGERNIEGLPEDCAFTTWYGDVRMENASITDLPAGEYTIQFYVCDWLDRANSNDNPTVVQGYVYAKTSTEIAEEDEAKAAAGEGETVDEVFAAQEAIIGGQGFNQVIEIPEIVVTDGKLVIGAQYTSDSQYFFSKIRLIMTGVATGFDYAKAYEDAKQAVETNIDAAKSTKVRAIQLFDLNGRSISKAQKGIVIVKKVMSDGTIKTEKVVK